MTKMQERRLRGFKPFNAEIYVHAEPRTEHYAGTAVMILRDDGKGWIGVSLYSPTDARASQESGGKSFPYIRAKGRQTAFKRAVRAMAVREPDVHLVGISQLAEDRQETAIQKLHQAIRITKTQVGYGAGVKATDPLQIRR